MVTNPKALAEVLTQRSYEFVRPERFRKGLGRLLGIGILVAEGDEHKVWKGVLSGGTRADNLNSVKEEHYCPLLPSGISRTCILYSGRNPSK